MARASKTCLSKWSKFSYYSIKAIVIIINKKSSDDKLKSFLYFLLDNKVNLFSKKNLYFFCYTIKNGEEKNY